MAFVAAERELLAPLGLSVPQLWRGVERASARLCEPPLTLCHGDCHIGNTYQLRVKPPTHSAILALGPNRLFRLRKSPTLTSSLGRGNPAVPSLFCSSSGRGKSDVSSGPKVERVFGAQDNRLGLLDWQLTLRSSWARDVSYIMATVTRTTASLACVAQTIPDNLKGATQASDDPRQ